MSNKRVHEIAKERGLAAKDVLARLKAAGVEVKASSSSVDEALASRVLANGGQAQQDSAGGDKPTAASKSNAKAARGGAKASDGPRPAHRPRGGAPAKAGPAPRQGWGRRPSVRPRREGRDRAKGRGRAKG